MRGRGDPAWARFYNACGRAMILLREGRITQHAYRVMYEQARRRAYREQAK